MVSRPRQPQEPVSGLSAAFLLVEYDLRQPAVHGPPDQPAVTAIAQILILWNREAKLKNPPIIRRYPNVQVKPGSHLCPEICHLATISERVDSIHFRIAKGRRVEGRISASRSIDYPTSSSKLWMNKAIIMPRWIFPTVPLLVPTKERGRN